MGDSSSCCAWREEILSLSRDHFRAKFGRWVSIVTILIEIVKQVPSLGDCDFLEGQGQLLSSCCTALKGIALHEPFLVDIISPECKQARASACHFRREFFCIRGWRTYS